MIPRELQDLCDQLVAKGGRVELRGRSFHAYAPDGAWLAVFSVSPRNARGARQSLTTKLRRVGVLG